MAASVVQFKSTSSSSSSPVTVSFDGAVTAGNAICAVVSSYYDGAVNAGTPWAITDDASGTYTEAIHDGSGSFGGISIFLTYNIAGGGAGFTVTLTLGFNLGMTLTVLELDGMPSTSPFDQTKGSGYVADPGSPWAFTTGNTATTAQANEVLIGAVHFFDGARTVTPGSGWSNVTKRVNTANGDAHQVSIKNVSATGTYAYDGNFDASPAFSTTAVIATFKEAAAAADDQPTMRRWGNVPYMGGQGIGQKGGGGGRTWGRHRTGLYLPEAA